jgi:predicted PurR-regulated permease PerM
MGIIPFLGLVLSIIPAVIIALVSGSVLLSLAKVALVYGLVQILDSGIISPRVVGDSVGLHPVWIVLALSVGGFFFGFVGLLISVPAAVGVKLVTVRGLERYRSSELYESPQG